MAGDWIKFEVATPDKPEVWQMSEDLNIDADAVVGKLLRVWVWFDQHSEEGNAVSVSKKLLDRLVGVTGFCDSMLGAGWMVEEGKEIFLPNFHRHNGKTAKNRALTAKRVAAHKVKTNANGNAPLTPAPLPKEEKRREENKQPLKAVDQKGKLSNLTGKEFPEGLDLDCWKEWLSYRKTDLKKPFKTARSEKTAVNKFVRECPTPDDQRASVENSISNGYQGLFAVKADSNSKSQLAPWQQHTASSVVDKMRQEMNTAKGIENHE